MSEWDQTWPAALLLLSFMVLPAACLLVAKLADWLMAGTVKLVRALCRYP